MADKAISVMATPGAPAVPSGQTKRKPPVKKALEEEEFTEALTTIVQRDFFPEIPKLRAQLEFIEATESNDYGRIKEISERFAATSSRTPAPGAATPTTFETPSVDPRATPQGGPKSRHKPCPASQPSEDSEDPEGPPDAKKPRPGESESLDKFLSEYQSEDDASFAELMEKAKEEQKRRYAWLYEREREAVAALEGPEERLAITDGGGERGGGVKAIEDRPSSVKTWRYTPKNSLMYIPEGIEESVREKVEGPSKSREVVHSNTRLSREFVKKTQAALQKASGEEAGQGGGGATKDKVGIDGKILGPAESPQVNGYGFVATPQIHPGVDASPLMTWGSIEGTPIHLETDVVSTSAPSFKMPKPPKREALAHRLADKANKANRERKKAAAEAASPALLRQRLGATPSTSERLRLLSPAARKLVSRAATPGSLHGSDKALRASYTPKHTPSSSPYSTPQHKESDSGTTPRNKSAGSSTPSLTDNLLNLKNI